MNIALDGISDESLHSQPNFSEQQQCVVTQKPQRLLHVVIKRFCVVVYSCDGHKPLSTNTQEVRESMRSCVERQKSLYCGLLLQSQWSDF